MSFVLASDVTPNITAPQIITQDLFPNIYTLDDVPNILYDETYETVPGIYRYGLPSSLTASIDSRYITGPQKYEYKYKNQQGVEVVLRGTYDDVMSAIDVLNTYPPEKRECTETGKRTYVPLYGPGSKKNPSVPTIGQIKQGDYIQLRMNNKIYSGSGALIIVFEKHTLFNFNNAKIILFKDSKNNQYQETGGKIDISFVNKSINKDTLFENSRKETEEESLKLFYLNKESPYFVEIESTTDNTFYRVYLYLFEMENSNQLTNLYDENRKQILDYRYSKEYMETDKLTLFDFNTFIQTVDNYKPLTYARSSGNFQTTSRDLVTVRDRTMKVIAKMNADGLFTTVMMKHKLQEYSPNVQGTFNVISLQ